MNEMCTEGWEPAINNADPAVHNKGVTTALDGFLYTYENLKGNE
jgi:hypothetical protein